METLQDIIIRTFFVMFVIISLTRLQGLRSFSKMSGFDFAVTVAVGSVLAGAITTLDTSVWVYAGAVGGLFLFQAIVAQLRARFDPVESLIDNTPLIVMRDGHVMHDNLKTARMTHDDLMGKLREANAYDMSKVHAVVVEATGDVSVLHGTGDVSPEVMDGLRGAD